MTKRKEDEYSFGDVAGICGAIICCAVGFLWLVHWTLFTVIPAVGSMIGMPAEFAQYKEETSVQIGLLQKQVFRLECADAMRTGKASKEFCAKCEEPMTWCTFVN